jgi:hypothetical protein
VARPLAGGTATAQQHRVVCACLQLASRDLLKDPDGLVRMIGRNCVDDALPYTANVMCILVRQSDLCFLHSGIVDARIVVKDPNGDVVHDPHPHRRARPSDDEVIVRSW